ncbi:MAG: hypothetical protein ACR2LJ_10145 [Acidimicrobiales bacterium]
MLGGLAGPVAEHGHDRDDDDDLDVAIHDDVDHRGRSANIGDAAPD